MLRAQRVNHRCITTVAQNDLNVKVCVSSSLLGKSFLNLWNFQAAWRAKCSVIPNVINSQCNSSSVLSECGATEGGVKLGFIIHSCYIVPPVLNFLLKHGFYMDDL